MGVGSVVRSRCSEHGPALTGVGWEPSAPLSPSEPPPTRQREGMGLPEGVWPLERMSPEGVRPPPELMPPERTPPGQPVPEMEVGPNPREGRT